MIKPIVYKPLSKDFFDALYESHHNIHTRIGQCDAMFHQSPNSSKQHKFARDYMKHIKRDDLTLDSLVTKTKDCAAFRTERGYITKPLSSEEAGFPIGFSLLMYKDSALVERLLRAIYMPQNFYCVHVDIKANPKEFEAIQSVAR